MALPDPIHQGRIGPSYVKETTATASTTTDIVLDADIGADQRVVVTRLRIQSSVASGLNFEDSDGTHLTSVLWVAAQRVFIEHDPAGVLCTSWGEGLQVVNPVGTVAEVGITFHVQDRSKGPDFL